MKVQTLLVLVFSISIVFSQENYTSVIENYSDQSIDEKIDCLFFISGPLGRTNPDALLPLIEALEIEANGQNRIDVLAFFDYFWAGYLVNKSLLNEARLSLERAEVYFKEVENDTMLAETNNLAANIEYLLGNNQNAEKHYLKSMSHGKASGITKFEIYSLTNYAKLLQRMDRYEEAISAIELYLDFFEINNNYKNIANGYAVLGSLYQSKNDLISAIKFFKKSLEASEKSNDRLVLSNGLTNIAIAHFIQEEYDLSYNNFKNALEERKKIGIPYYISQSYHNLGDYKQSLSQLKEALIYYDSALQVSLTNNLNKEALDAYQELAATHELLGDHQKSNEYLKKFIELQSRFQKNNNDTELMLLQRNHDFYLQRERILGNSREIELKSKVYYIQETWRYWIWIIVGSALLILLIIIRIKK
jgi:tetratricopeptide (TPR) repeat protein